MLYYNQVTVKIVRVLRFREIEKDLFKCQTSIPTMIAAYQVPINLRRQVYFTVMRYLFPRLTLEALQEMLNYAYPKKEIYPKETQYSSQANKVN